VQPVLWLLLFGEVMAQVRGVSPGNLRYLDFLSAGILAQSVLFVAIFYGITAIWERDLGVLQRYLVSPPPLSALVVGKALLAGVRALASIHRLAPRSSRNDAAIRNQILNDISKQSWSAGSRRWRITCPGKAVQFCEFNGASFLRISAAIKGRWPVGRCRCRPAGSSEHHCLR
jgi:hypothetical protein